MYHGMEDVKYPLIVMIKAQDLFINYAQKKVHVSWIGAIILIFGLIIKLLMRLLLFPI